LPPPPDRQSPEAHSFLAAQLAAFQKSLEDWTGRKIATGDLDRGIDVMNEHRRLLHAAWEIRKKDPPLLTGREALYLTVSSQWVDKGEHNRLLGEALEKELLPRRPPGGGRMRLMVLGDDTRAVEGVHWIEALEAVVVIDDLDCGSRYFWNEVFPAEDRLAAIAARYLERPGPGNPERVRALARDWRVQGALIFQGPDRAVQEGDLSSLQRALSGSGIPSLAVELGDGTSLSRLKIRVEAFLESLCPEDLF
jgi:benzoyl-CoA reductase/2-hydroxyglutaryl-CoA dehydratase subunit BcrC/BadD/HgdB